MLKVLWLCNQKIPIIAYDIGTAVSVFGGWLEDMSNRLMQSPNNNLIFLFPHHSEISGCVNRLKYYGYSEKECQEYFSEIIKKEQPDVIHIWGTEFSHTLQMINACENCNMLDHTIISIQGLVSIYAQHYCLGMPEKVVNHRTIHELLRGGNISDGKKNYLARGEKEIEAIKKVRHVIGRTDFDRACTKQVNPYAHYYICNETLRSGFWGNPWDLNTIKRHSIFISQCNYPIKGFHIFLKALSIVIKQYPDVHVYAAGENPARNASDLFHRSTYAKYISKLICDFELENSITFLGMLDEKAMYQQYRAANVFVSASTIENSPNSVGEAMLVGCPVISSFVGGIQTMIDHGKDGFLYQVDAPYMLAYYIELIFENDEIAMNLSNNSRRRALITHDPENNYNKLLSIYDEVNGGVDVAHCLYKTSDK